jgi:hypothetical protein
LGTRASSADAAIDNKAAAIETVIFILSIFILCYFTIMVVTLESFVFSAQ